MAKILGPDNELAYDALVLDFQLGKTDAMDLLKELRHERGLDIPVVVTTLQGDEETAARALLLGARDTGENTELSTFTGWLVRKCFSQCPIAA